MSPRAAAASVLLAVVMLVSAAADARECRIDLGRGWPPATGNYGAAVEQLFTGKARPVLSLAWLPRTGKETGVALWPGAAADADWTLRYSKADERVHNWSGDGIRLRVDQVPRQAEAPIPAVLARRVVDAWQAILRRAAPEGVAAGVQEGDVVSFVVAGERFSGSLPNCGPAERLLQQAELLIQASEEKETKRERRWSQLEQSLQSVQQSPAATGG